MMDLVKVIVQNIPLAFHGPCRCSNCNCSHSEVIFSEELFRRYGPAKCTYLWSQGQTTGVGRTRVNRVHDNFAHVVFKNTDDALRACKAANCRKIKMGKNILTLTAVTNDSEPIEMLTDYCLMEVFSLLDVSDKLAVEKVCRRWEALILRDWLTTKVLDLTKVGCDEMMIEQCVTRCGSYAREVHCKVNSSGLFALIGKHCDKIESLKLEILKSRAMHWDKMSAVFEKLTKLRVLVLIDFNGFMHFDFLRYLPQTVESITIKITFQENSSRHLNFSKYYNLKSLTVHRYQIDRNSVRGIEHMKSLTHLDLSAPSGLDVSNIEKIRNFKKLRALKISHSDVPDNVIVRILRNNRELEHLDLSYIHTLKNWSVVQASTLPNLKVLNIAGSSIVTLNAVNPMVSLESLNCEGCPRVTDKTLRPVLVTSPNLKFLNVRFCLVTAEFLATADAVVRSRKSGAPLEIKSTITGYHIDYESLSPLLKVDCIWKQKGERVLQ